MKRKVMLARLFSVAVLLATSASSHLCGQGDELDVEALFARSIVIDGTVNYYSTISGSGIGQPDFTRDKQGRSVKQATGIDIGGITIGSERGLNGQLANLVNGRYRGAMLIRTAQDIDRAVAEKKYGILFYVQTHYPLEGDVKNIQRWYDNGLRIFQLQYGSRDANQSAAEKLGGGTDQEGGLTPLGRKVVLELIRLGVVIDLSHCNAPTTIEAAQIAKGHGVPVTANHIAVRNLKTADGRWRARYARNITDEELLAIKETGGVVGVMAYGPYLSGPYQELRVVPPDKDIPHATIDDYVAHVDYIAKRIGVDYVGLSTDGYLDGTMAHSRTADGILDSPRRWKEAIRRLHARGYSEADLQKIMGQNFLRVYRQVLR